MNNIVYKEQKQLIKMWKDKYYEKKEEIERLTKQNKALNEMYELTKKEYIRLNNIVKEVREYVDKWEDISRYKLLEILDKENSNE